MGTITLDERDTTILERLREGDSNIEALADRTSCQSGYLRDRLPKLADNGLVERVDASDDESAIYRLTDSGKRALLGSPAGAMDDRIDTPDDVESEIRSFDLRPDREAAVRSVFAFLKYWGEAFEGEIIDAVYSEVPAGYESSEAWWNDCVREHLAGLPRVEAPDSSGEPWRYSGTPIVDETTDDGRLTPGTDVTAQTSVKYALERADLSESETSAVRAAFEQLVHQGEASAGNLKDEVYPDHDAGYGVADEWWRGLIRETFESLPGVERVDETDDGEAGEPDAGRGDEHRDRWRYHERNEGSMSIGPGVDIPEGPLGPDDKDET